MNPAIRGGLRPWLLAICTVAVALMSTGCIVPLAFVGISPAEIPSGDVTRAEVRAKLGEPESARLLEDGTRVEIYRIQLRLDDRFAREIRNDPIYTLLLSPVPPDGWLVNVIGPPIMVAELAKNRFGMVFVYGPDDRLLYQYRADAPPAERFIVAAEALQGAFRKHVQEAECLRWVACVEAFWKDFSQLAAGISYTLTEGDKAAYRNVLEIAEEMDGGQISRDEGMRRMRAANVLGSQERALPSVFAKPPTMKVEIEESCRRDSTQTWSYEDCVDVRLKAWGIEK